MSMPKRVLALICTLSFLMAVSAPAAAVEAVRCGLMVYQFDTESNTDILLYADTTDFLKNVSATGFLVGLSVEVKFSRIDSQSVSFTVHVLTHAARPGNYAREFQVEYGLPATLKEMIGKNGARYTLMVTPLEAVEIDTAWCGYQHNVADVFRFDPTAHLDIFYVPGSLGDYRWNTIKAMMEYEYDRFDDLCHFTQPGKYNLYLCPCYIPSVIWDGRFGMMIDPTRNSIFGILARDFNSVYPFVINQAALLHNYGYSPPFLSEGFANYLSFAIYETKKLQREGKLLPLEDLLATYEYYRVSPVISDRTAATFVRYLVEQYGIDQFLKLYRQADDVNLRRTLEDVYAKSTADLESEWLTYVDTITIKYGQASFYEAQAESMQDYPLMLTYALEMQRLASSKEEKIRALGQLVRAGFSTGDYYRATKTQRELIDQDSAGAAQYISLAAYELMNGEYDLAQDHLIMAQTLDSTNQLVTFNMGLCHLVKGEDDEAREMFSRIVNDPKGGAGRLESQSLLGHMLLATKDDKARNEAINYFTQVVNMLSRSTSRDAPAASESMWQGICYLGLEDTGNALEFLNTALFLETRPFYVGMIQLWLGKVADIRGEREVARSHYGQVLALSSAVYHQEEARQFLQTPYEQ